MNKKVKVLLFIFCILSLCALLTIIAFICSLVGGLSFYKIFNIKSSQVKKKKVEFVEAEVSVKSYYKYLKSDAGVTVEEVVVEDGSQDPDFKKGYLKTCGGMIPVRYYLKTDSGKQIRSKNELKAFLGQISSIDEAIAYMYAQNCDFVDQFEEHKPRGKKVDGAYYLELIYYPVFGCGIHAHQKKTFILEDNGEYVQTNVELLEDGEHMCVD